ncbi:hypothetical protein [Pectinatus frisingensis]|uniref:hypothetical protein n=1 Tax=Pectinatus frisingensis TaxID=865 RepID=UPI0018C628AB|nr:hypothetical protein [Pectinatus frisingensis]
MSQELFQLQNNEILVSKDSKTYADTLSNFKLDYSIDYSNCRAFTSAFIMYNRSLSQYVLGNTIQTYGAQKDLDTIIDSIDSIINAQNARISATYKYCASNYGLTVTSVSDTYVAETGEILFSSTPTVAQLTTAFPSTAGTCTYTVTANSVAGDTITFANIILTNSITLTSTASTTDANDYAVGSDIATTIKNIVTALQANTLISQYFTVTYTATTFTLTEKVAGNKNTPVVASTTGSIGVSTGSITTSVYGYKNALIAQQLVTLNAQYVNKNYPVERGLVTAYAKNNTSTVTSLNAKLTALNNEFNTKAQAIING